MNMFFNTHATIIKNLALYLHLVSAKVYHISDDYHFTNQKKKYDCEVSVGWILMLLKGWQFQN